MAKTTVHLGGVNALVPEEVLAVAESEPEGGEDLSAGSSSSKSTEKPKKTASKKSVSGRSPAQTTEPSSKKDLGVSGSAGGTGGDGKDDS